VAVEHLLLGRCQGSHISADLHSDTALFRVARDSTGLPGIDCSRIDFYSHGASRWGVEAMTPYIGDLDEDSRRAWETARHEAARLIPDRG
jgi:hypothetical protein